MLLFTSAYMTYPLRQSLSPFFFFCSLFFFTDKISSVNFSPGWEHPAARASSVCNPQKTLQLIPHCSPTVHIYHLLHAMAGNTDPINFWKAEDYFDDIHSWDCPQEVEEIIPDPPADIADPNHWHGITLKFVGGKLCSLQYIRPTVWRIRFDPTVISHNEYKDINTLECSSDRSSWS